jgi:eukaryotic-like serine/threonine-protein kinase
MLQEPTLLTVGTLLRERYLIKSVLGSGSVGTTYLVKDQQVRSIKYSLFILKEIAGLDQAARYQFTFSGATLRQIQHQALPHIYAIFNDDKRGCIYLVMDYVEGSDLETLRLQQPAGCFSWSELQPLCEPVFAALTYLHRQEQPLFHGNIKPTSMLQSITGKVLLVDLGYVQATTPEMRKATFASLSSSYLAPEQFEGTVDERSDVYGLGATLYTLLTGQAPADAHIRLARVSRRKSDPLQLASKITPHVPQALAEVLQKALALDPSERFASVREFWQALNTQALSNGALTQALARPATPIPTPAGPMGVAALPTLVKNPSSPTAAPIAQPVRNPPPRRALLPGVTLLCILLLVLIGVGTWAWATTHTRTSQQNTPSSAPGMTQHTPGPGAPTPTSVFGPYPHMLGTYRGVLIFLDTTRSNFTLIIKHQVDDQISGIFSSTRPDGTFKASGKIDQQGDIDISIVDSSGNAFLGLSGGFNGIDDPITSTLGGSFYSCVPKHGATCLQDPNSTTLSGSWTLSFVSSAF